LPLAVWMLRSFFSEVPRELIEAAEIDGASFLQRVTRILLPIVGPGVSATALLCFIFAWNEFFLAVNLTTFRSQTVPIWVTTMISTRGQFLAKLSAASTLACLPVVLAGWAAQKRLVRGLTMRGEVSRSKRFRSRCRGGHLLRVIFSRARTGESCGGSTDCFVTSDGLSLPAESGSLQRFSRDRPLTAYPFEVLSTLRLPHGNYR
jgi:ABC-type Fe3+ transport system permease subunit